MHANSRNSTNRTMSGPAEGPKMPTLLPELLTVRFRALIELLELPLPSSSLLFRSQLLLPAWTLSARLAALHHMLPYPHCFSTITLVFLFAACEHAYELDTHSVSPRHVRPVGCCSGPPGDSTAHPTGGSSRRCNCTCHNSNSTNSGRSSSRNKQCQCSCVSDQVAQAAVSCAVKVSQGAHGHAAADTQYDRLRPAAGPADRWQ